MADKLYNPGHRVTLIEIPFEVVRDRLRFPETFTIFQRAVRRSFTVRDVDKHGHIELWVQEDGSEDETGGKHSVWVEPAFLELANS